MFLRRDLDPSSSNNISTSIIKSWEFVNGSVSSYYDDCIFAEKIAKQPSDAVEVERHERCAKLRFMPYSGYQAPDPISTFQRLPPNGTIYMFGDSVSLQHSKDLLCLLSSISKGEPPALYSVSVLIWGA